MPRIVDPSELEGDDLTSWYLRSPSDVEAEREAARQDQYNSFLRSFGDAVQRRPPIVMLQDPAQ